MLLQEMSVPLCYNVEGYYKYVFQFLVITKYKGKT